jgi:hypothetical protein
MIKPIANAVKAAKIPLYSNVFYKANSFMKIGMYKISHFSTAVFEPSTLKPTQYLKKPIRFEYQNKTCDDNYSREHCTIILCQ